MHLPADTDTRPHRDTVVLLHASGSSARQWDALAERLRPTHEVHAIDLHGHGQGPAWNAARPLAVADDAALALEVLRRAGGGHVIGHSYGAAVAVCLAAAHPQQVRSLAVYEPVLFSLLGGPAAGAPAAVEATTLGRFVVAAVAQGRLGDAAERFVDYWSAAGTWARMGPERRHALARRMPVIAAQFTALNAAGLGPAGLARLTMPLLCLHGTRSTPAAIAIAGLLRGLLPAGRHEALAGLGHMAPLVDAEVVNTRLLRFLRGVSAPAETAALAVA